MKNSAKNQTAMNMIYAFIDTNYITSDDILTLFGLSISKYWKKFEKICYEVRDRYFEDMETKDVDLDVYVDELSDKIIDFFDKEL